MTRGDLKTSRAGSRTPFQILADYYQAGDTRDRSLWREYARATRHLGAVRWSRGLRVVILGPAAEPALSDEHLAVADVNGELVTVIPLPCGRASGSPTGTRRPRGRRVRPPGEGRLGHSEGELWLSWLR